MVKTDINSNSPERLPNIDLHIPYQLRKTLFSAISDKTDPTIARLILSDPRTLVISQGESVEILNPLLKDNGKILTSLPPKESISFDTQEAKLADYPSSFPLGSIKSVEFGELSPDDRIRLALEPAAQIPLDTINNPSMGHLRIAAFARSAAFIAKTGNPKLGREIIQRCFQYYSTGRQEGARNRILLEALLDYAIHTGDEALCSTLLRDVRLGLRDTDNEVRCSARLVLTGDSGEKLIKWDSRLYIEIASEFDILERHRPIIKLLKSNQATLDERGFSRLIEIAVPSRRIIDLPTIEVDVGTGSELEQSYANHLAESLTELRRSGAESLMTQLVSKFADYGMFEQALTFADQLNTRSLQLCAYGVLLSRSSVSGGGNTDHHRKMIDQIIASTKPNDLNEQIAIMLRHVAVNVPEGYQALGDYIPQITDSRHRAKYELILSLTDTDPLDSTSCQKHFYKTLAASPSDWVTGQPMYILADIALIASKWGQKCSVLKQLDALLDDVPKQLKYMKDGEAYYNYVACAYNAGMHDIVIKRASQCVQSSPARISSLLLGARSAFAIDQIDTRDTFLATVIKDIDPQGIMDEFAREAELVSLSEVLEEEWKHDAWKLFSTNLRLMNLAYKNPWRVALERWKEFLQTAVAAGASDNLVVPIRACQKLIDENSKDERMYYQVAQALYPTGEPIKTKGVIFP